MRLRKSLALVPSAWTVHLATHFHFVQNNIHNLILPNIDLRTFLLPYYLHKKKLSKSLRITKMGFADLLSDAGLTSKLHLINLVP